MLGYVYVIQLGQNLSKEVCRVVYKEVGRVVSKEVGRFLLSVRFCLFFN